MFYYYIMTFIIAIVLSIVILILILFVYWKNINNDKNEYFKENAILEKSNKCSDIYKNNQIVRILVSCFSNIFKKFQ